MSDTVHLELSRDDRDVLLRGLRYVRSSIMLETREPSPEDTAGRSQELRHIAALVDQLNGAPSARETAQV